MSDIYREGQSVTVVDAWLKNPTDGKIIFIRESGLAVDDARGVRHWVTLDRVRSKSTVRYDLFGALAL